MDASGVVPSPTSGSLCTHKNTQLCVFHILAEPLEGHRTLGISLFLGSRAPWY